MPSNRNHEHRWGVILAGGSGTRLRPLTRRISGDDRPKQFCPLVGGMTLLARTRERIASEIAPARTLLVLTREHEAFYLPEITGLDPDQVIEQPDNRGTLPAILWSLLRVARLDDQATLAFFPSDHHFSDDAKFLEGVRTAFEAADEEKDSPILLGTPALRPEVEFGWIEPEPGPVSARLRRIRRFWEKPSLNIAKDLLHRGCLWNTFVMVGRIGAFMRMIESAMWEWQGGLRAALKRPEAEQILGQIYHQLDTADFSHRALSVNTQRLRVLALDEVGWNDLGDPRRALAALGPMPAGSDEREVAALAQSA